MNRQDAKDAKKPTADGLMTGRAQGWVAGVCVLLVAALIAWMVNWQALSSAWDDPAEYHLRQLKWHGRESKDLGQQRYHADQLIALGRDAAPCLIREAISHGGFGERWEPSVIEMLRSIGRPAHAAVVRELAAPEIVPTTDSVLKTPEAKRALLIGVFVQAFDDWTFFEEWLATVDESPGSYVKSRQIQSVAWRVRERFADAPPLTADGDTLNPAFLEWWREAGKRRQEATRVPPP